MENNFELVLRTETNILESNIDYLKDNLKNLMLNKYTIEVNNDNLKDAKKVMAEINKGKKGILDAWKCKKEELNTPIKDLDAKIKDLVSICDDARSKIEVQVNEYELKTREEAKKVCEEYKISLCKDKGIDPDSLPLIGFDNLTFINDKGNITSLAKQKVENIVLNEVARLAELKQKEHDALLEKQRIEKEAIERYKLEKEITNKEVKKDSNGLFNHKVSVTFSFCSNIEDREKIISFIKEELSKNSVLADKIISID